MTDLDELLPSLAAGDQDAFGRFVAGAELAVRKSLRSFAALLDTEALVQETFLRVWQVAPRFTPDGGAHALLRFTVRVARNLAVSELRKRREEPVGDEGPTATVEAVAVDPLLRRVILLCLEKLSAPTRGALVARLESAGAEPDHAIAMRVGMRPNTFLQNVTRARRSLADCLETQGVALDPTVFGGRPREGTEAP